MKIIFEISGIVIVYFPGYLIGFKSGVRSIIDELNMMTREILSRTEKMKKENNIVKKCE